jgi:predicted RNA-binding protein with PUA-like domain
VAVSYWLFKSEPTAYSFEDLVQDGTAEWDGVRNFQVRNWLRDAIKTGDRVLFYYSNTKVIGIVGTATVVRDGYPDNTAWDPSSEHPDPKSTPENPIWYMVDIQAGQRFAETVTPDEMRPVAELSDMVVLKKGNRLSITPVTAQEFQVIEKLGMAK